MTVPGQDLVQYTYNNVSRLTEVASGTLLVGIAYDAAGRRTSLTYPNGTNTIFDYDTASRLTSLAHQGPSGPIENLTYAYDPVGNLINMNRVNADATTLPASVQAAYDAANQQVQFNSAATNLTFDGNGNLESHIKVSNTATYTWDARNRLVAIQDQGASATFAYDVFGRRIRKTINGKTTQYLYDDKNIVAELNGGTISVRYLRSLNVDEPFIRISGSETEFYHVDALGSTISLTNLAGLVSTTYEYDPFGNTSANGLSTNTFQYAGRENDGIGLYYYRARYYTPLQARFLSQDPILAPLTPLTIGLCIKTNRTTWLLPSRLLNTIGGDESSVLNAYAYVKNNPLRFTDPIGLEKKKPDCDEATQKCTKGLQKDMYSGANGDVATCYSAGMGSGAAYGEGNDQQNHATNMEKCTRGSVYELVNPTTGRNDWPVPDDCTNEKYQKNCT